MPRSPLAVAAALVTVMSAGCTAGASHPASPGSSATRTPVGPRTPLTARSLSAHLLVDDDLLPGWVTTSLEGLGLDDSGDSATPGASTGSSEPALECSDVADSYSFIRDLDTHPVGHAASFVNGEKGAITTTGTVDSMGVNGGEDLFSYSGDDAHAVLQRVRDFVAMCPVVTDDMGSAASLVSPSASSSLDLSGDITSKYTLAAGPALGDESFVIHQRVTMSSHPGATLASVAVFIRAGTTVIVLHTLSTSLNNAGLVESLAPAAFKKAIGA